MAAIDGIETRKTFKQRLITTIIISLCLAISIHLISSRYSIVFGHQQCLDGKVWLIEKNVLPQKGEYIYIKGTHIPRYEKVRLVKLVEGVEGDVVRVLPAAEGITGEVIINNMPRKLKIRAYVQLVDTNGTVQKVYPVYKEGTNGSELPFLLGYGTTVIKNGYYVAGTHPASYDSRYYGIVDKKDVLGRAILIF